MNKKIFIIALSALALSGCNSFNVDDVDDNNDVHQHTFETDWTYDENEHWKAASCEHKDIKSEVSEHDFVTKAGENREECIVCGYSRNKNTPVVPGDSTNKDFYSKIYDSYNLCREIERNGAVLLKNKEALPLKSTTKKITLLGTGSKSMFLRSSAIGPGKTLGIAKRYIKNLKIEELKLMRLLGGKFL